MSKAFTDKETQQKMVQESMRKMLFECLKGV